MAQRVDELPVRVKGGAQVRVDIPEVFARFGGPAFHSTRLDVLGPQIAELLARAGRGEAGAEAAAPEHEHRARMVL